MAGFDKVDPANPCLLCSVARVHAWAGPRAHDGRVGLQPHREMPARALDEGIPVVGEYALHRRTGAVGKVRVLTS
jgi:hypothetical protein